MSEQEKNLDSNSTEKKPDNEIIIQKNVGSKLGLKLFLGIVLVASLSALTVGFIANNNHEKMLGAVEIESIYNNIFIGDLDVGGLTKDEAKQKITDDFVTPNSNKKITLKNNTSTFDFLLKDFGLEYDINKAVDEAYSYAREGSLKERYKKITELKDNPHKINLDYKYDENLVPENVASIAEHVYLEPVNATMSRTDGVFNITSGIDGVQMDVDKTSEEVKKLINSVSGGEIEIFTESVRPTYTADDFEQAQSLIGTFYTSYYGSGTGRITNMEVASSKIDGYVLYPGEIFSTNNEFGPSTYENGYRDAPVIENGELIEGIGGGVCQVSSTLYNAVLRAELEIVERRNHSLKVGYTDWGFDATLAGDYIDLKFKNNTDLPIFIESYLTADRVVCNIYGYEIHIPGRTLEFKNALIKTTPPGAEKITYTPTLLQGQKEVKLSAVTGYTYEVYKFVYENGELLEKVLVNTSVYKPRRAEILMGTKTNVAEDTAANTAPAENVTANKPVSPVQAPPPVIETPAQDITEPPEVITQDEVQEDIGELIID